MKLSEAKSLKGGEHLHGPARNGRIVTVKVNGKAKVWKTRPSEVQIPCKYGLYEYFHLTERDIANWELGRAPASAKAVVKAVRRNPQANEMKGGESELRAEMQALRGRSALHVSRGDVYVEVFRDMDGMFHCSTGYGWKQTQHATEQDVVEYVKKVVGQTPWTFCVSYGVNPARGLSRRNPQATYKVTSRVGKHTQIGQSSDDIGYEIRRAATHPEGKRTISGIMDLATAKRMAQKLEAGTKHNPASSPKEEVYAAMQALMPYAVRKFGEPLILEVLKAPPVVKGAGMSGLKQLQTLLVYAVGDAASYIDMKESFGGRGVDTQQYDNGRGGQVGAPMPTLSVQAARWVKAQNDSVLYTIARKVLSAYAKGVGITLDATGMIHNPAMSTPVKAAIGVGLLAAIGGAAWYFTKDKKTA